MTLSLKLMQKTTLLNCEKYHKYSLYEVELLKWPKRDTYVIVTLKHRAYSIHVYVYMYMSVCLSIVKELR